MSPAASPGPSAKMCPEIKRLEVELEKARNGLAMPYDRERVWQGGSATRGAPEVAHAQGQTHGGQAQAEAKVSNDRTGAARVRARDPLSKTLTASGLAVYLCRNPAPL